MNKLLILLFTLLTPLTAFAQGQAVDYEKDHIRGNMYAPISVIEYGDYECPYCLTFHPVLQQVLDHYDGKTNWVYRHFPLELFPNAFEASYAAECIGKYEGHTAFWKYTDYLLETLRNKNRANLIKYSSLAGVNGLKLRGCLEAQETVQDVNDDIESGRAFGVDGTPGVVILNHVTRKWKRIGGATEFTPVKLIIDELLEEIEPYEDKRYITQEQLLAEQAHQAAEDEATEEEPVEEETIVVCHRPPGTNADPVELTINASAWETHMEHGDTIGACPTKEEEEQLCVPLFETEENNENNDAINMVFAFQGYTEPQREKAQMFAQYLSLFWPFTANSPQRVQFWMHTQPEKKPENVQDDKMSCLQLCGNGPRCSNLSNEAYVHLCDAICNPVTSIGSFKEAEYGVTYLSHNDDKAVFVHQVGHMVGKLEDAYAGRHCPEGETCPEGEDSIMKNHRADYALPPGGFGEENVQKLWDVISNFTGLTINDIVTFTQRIPGKPLLNLLAQIVSELEENPLAQSGSSSSETALRVTMERGEDGAFKVSSVSSTVTPFGIKPSHENGNVVKVSVGDKTYSQTFSASEKLISDIYTADGIELNSYEEFPKETIAVYVGLGDEVTVDENSIILPNGTHYEIAIDVEECNSEDEDENNDCPPPMFHGSEINTEAFELTATAHLAASRRDTTELTLNAINAYFAVFAFILLFWLIYSLFASKSKDYKKEI